MSREITEIIHEELMDLLLITIEDEEDCHSERILTSLNLPDGMTRIDDIYVKPETATRLIIHPGKLIEYCRTNGLTIKADVYNNICVTYIEMMYCSKNQPYFTYDGMRAMSIAATENLDMFPDPNDFPGTAYLLEVLTDWQYP